MRTCAAKAKTKLKNAAPISLLKMPKKLKENLALTAS